jgi:type III secretory pathway component EscV
VKVRILEDGPTIKKGLVDLIPELALKLIAQGIAVRVKEDTTDKEAKDVLSQARSRDQEPDSNAK